MDAKGTKLKGKTTVWTAKVVRRINLRSSGKKVRETVRRQTYELFQKGAKISEVARCLGVQAATVGRWFRMFRAGDDSIFRGECRRGPAEPQRLLDQSRMEELRRIVVNRSPVECQLAYRRWSYAAVAELVKAKFGLKVSRVTAGKWLKLCQKGEVE